MALRFLLGSLPSNVCVCVHTYISSVYSPVMKMLPIVCHLKVPACLWMQFFFFRNHLISSKVRNCLILCSLQYLP